MPPAPLVRAQLSSSQGTIGFKYQLATFLHILQWMNSSRCKQWQSFIQDTAFC